MSGKFKIHKITKENLSEMRSNPGEGWEIGKKTGKGEERKGEIKKGKRTGLPPVRFLGMVGINKKMFRGRMAWPPFGMSMKKLC